MKGTTLLQPHRRLIREGPLQSISTKSLFGSIKMSNRVFFLFSDILLWTGVDFEFKGARHSFISLHSLLLIHSFIYHIVIVG
jgi:hypothetical protein